MGPQVRPAGLPVRIMEDIAIEVGQDLPALLVDAQHPRRPAEPDPSQMVKERVNSPRPRPRRTPHRVTDPDNLTSPTPTRQLPLRPPPDHPRRMPTRTPNRDLGIRLARLVSGALFATVGTP